MKKLLSLTITFVLAIQILACATAFAGPQLKIDEDSWIKFMFLGQGHFSYNDDAADKEDFYLRRGRIILMGQITDGVKFFAETDNDNAGKNGTSGVSTDIQDAFLDLRLLSGDAGELWLQGGLILLPFSFEGNASAASLLGIDYNAEAVKLVNSFVWRDYGASFRGNLGTKVACRLGVFDGYDKYTSAGIEKNNEAPLRVTGHLAVNVVGDVESGWFYSQNRLGKANYLSIGTGIDQQDKATVTVVPEDDTTGAVPEEQDSSNWVVDFQSGFGLNETLDLTVNGAYYTWDNAAFEGNTAFLEAGLLINKKAMITGKYSQTDQDHADEVENYTAGLHYFIKGHNARAGLEHRWGDSDDWTLLGIQFLL